MDLFYYIFLIQAVDCAPCQAAQFHAKEEWKSLTSPYFPDTIHAKTQCEWEIKAPKGSRIKIGFDVLELLNHRTNGRCTTQSVDIIDGPRIRDSKNDAITLCGKKKPLTDFITSSNIARVRIVSDYYGENMNNKFKLRYQITQQPANFKGHSNDEIKTDPGGFVVRQSALSNERRVPSGGQPHAAQLTGDEAEQAAMGEWGKPPKKKKLASGITAAIDGRTMIRSRSSFRPKIRMKSVPLPPPGPTEYVHVPPPNPEDVRQGYVYTGPDVIPDPNAPLEIVNGGEPVGDIHGGDPWGLIGPTPPADILNNGFRPEVMVRPAGWIDLNVGDELTEYNDEPEVDSEPNEMEKWISEMGLDINPWLLLVGAGGVVIFIVGILIAKSIKDFKEKQKLEKLQLDTMLKGPAGLFNTTTGSYKPADSLKPPPLPEMNKTTSRDLVLPPDGFRDETPRPNHKENNYSDIHTTNQLTKVSNQLEKFKIRTGSGARTGNRGRNSVSFSASPSSSSPKSDRDHQGHNINRANFRPTTR